MADLLNMDPVEQAYNSRTAGDQAKYLDLYAKSAQVANILVVGAAAVQKANGQLTMEEAALSVVKAMGQTYVEAKTATGVQVATIDLAGATFIRAVFDNIQSDAALVNVSAVTTALSNVNQSVADIIRTADANSKASLNALVATEFASQYDLTADILGRLDSQNQPRSLDVANYSGDGWSQKLEDYRAVVGSLAAPDPGGRGQAIKPLLVHLGVEASPSEVLSLIGPEKLSDSYVYTLKQDLNKDVVKGDIERLC
jgi:hypothetical protein